MNNDLHAKALRAAEWWKSTGKGTASFDDQLLWCVTENGQSWADDVMITDRIMIAFCEERGWQDAEDDGVEWTSYQDYAEVGRFSLYVTCRRGWGDRFAWYVSDNVNCSRPELKGTGPTRAEARRAALEAARGLDAN